MIRPEMFSPSWVIKPLGEVADFLDHRRHPITARDRIPGPYPYYGANGQQDSVADYLFDEPLILLAEDGGYFGDPEKTIAYRVEGKCWVNNHAHVLRPRDGVDIVFLCRQLEQYDVTPFVNGATRQKLTKTSASEIPIALPPLEEQKRIAAILDKTDEIRRKRQTAIKLADDFLRATFLDMFGDPVTNPKGWQEEAIAKLLSDRPNAVRTGPFGSQLKHSEFTSEGIPVLGIDNIVTNNFRSIFPRRLPHEKYECFKRYRVYPDDLIITIMGTTGRVAVAPPHLPECMSTKHLCVLTLNTRQIDPVFLWATLLYDNKARNQAKMSSGGAVMEGWNMGIIMAISVRVPPLDEQLKFRKIVQLTNELKAKLTTWGAQDCNRLFNSLTQRAFRGEL